MKKLLPFLLFPYTLFIQLSKKFLHSFYSPIFRKSLYLSLFSWILIVFCTPPLLGEPLIFIALIPFFIALEPLSIKQATLVSFLSAIPYHFAMYYWLYNTIPKIEVPEALVLFGMGLLFLYFSLFNALLGLLYKTAQSSKFFRYTWPLAWAGLEVFRSSGDMSFPWGHLAYTLGNWQSILQGLAWIGSFLYTAIILWVNLAGLKAWKTRKWTPLIPAISIIVIAWVYGSVVLSKPLPKGPSADVALIQPSILQTNKWEKGHFKHIVTKTFTMISDSSVKGADWIVVPETAIPDFLRIKKENRELQKLANQMQTKILIGALDYDRKGPKARHGYRYFNAAYLYTPNQFRPRIYHKIQLVPFSERLPFESIIPAISFVDLGEGDFSSGAKLMMLDSTIPAVAHICYESIYPYIMRMSIKAGAKLVLNITNDGWFGRSSAPWQHLNQVRIRAIENGIPVARAANSGISALIDSRGTILKKTKLYEKKILRGKIPLRTSTTLYSQIGSAVEWVLQIIFFLHLFRVFIFRRLYKR